MSSSLVNMLRGVGVIPGLPTSMRRNMQPPPIDPGIRGGAMDLQNGIDEPQGPQGDGDSPNSLLRDIGADPGTGLARTPEASGTLSSTPSGELSPDHTAPPSNHGSDNDIITRAPKVQLPDVNTFPETQRITDLQGQLDQSRQPLTMKQRLLKLGLSAAPVAIGAALGGVYGAGSAAGGVADEGNVIANRGIQEQGELEREIGSAQSSRNARYGAETSAAHANATLQSNALLRDAMIKSQQHIAEGHDATRQQVATTGADSRESIATDKNKLMSDMNAVKTPLIQAQTELASARAKGIPEQIRLAEERVRIAQQSANASSSRADTQAKSLESSLYGTQNGQPIPGAPVVDGQVEGFKPYAATGPTGTTKTKMDQVDAITSVGKTLLTEIDKNKSALGPFTGRWKNLEEMWGNLPPEAARVAGLQESFASLQPALHQFRSTSAKRDFERRLQIGSFKTNAEAMKAGVQAAMDSAAEMKGAWSAPSGRGYTPPKSNTSGAVEFIRDPNTGRITRKGQGQ